jgi:hypothetical protein
MDTRRSTFVKQTVLSARLGKSFQKKCSLILTKDYVVY